MSRSLPSIDAFARVGPALEAYGAGIPPVMRSRTWMRPAFVATAHSLCALIAQ